MELSVISKMLQTLKEIAPNITHVWMIYNPDNPAATLFARSFQSAAGPLGVEPTVTQIHGLADIERAVAAAAAQPKRGIFIPLDVTIAAFAEQTVAAIARHRLPAIYSEREFVTKGGWFITARIAANCTVALPPMWIASYAEKSLAICPSSSQPSTSW